LVPSGNEEKIPYHKYRLLVKPGMTGWAQVMYHESLTPDTVPERIKYDLYYIKNMGFLLDFIIILKTMRIVLSRRGT
jgi:lipopolysaccharide/colanic/teichoic acid biosynthesis glycosyltransferase